MPGSTGGDIFRKTKDRTSCERKCWRCLSLQAGRYPSEEVLCHPICSVAVDDEMVPTLFLTSWSMPTADAGRGLASREHADGECREGVGISGA